jgi:hypothetical protein
LQESITNLYQGYVSSMVSETYRLFMTPVKATNRNCFHLACLNRYQRCLNVLEYMFEELSNFNIDIDVKSVQLYN